MSLKIMLLVSTFSFAGFSDLDEKDQYLYPVKKVRRQRIRSVIKKRDHSLSYLADRLIKGDQKLYDLIKRRESNVIVRKKQLNITSLTRVKGTVLNSILAMNIKAATFIVKIDDSHEELGLSELKCQGVSFQKRVVSKCSLLVLEGREYPVNISLWDEDGAEGIISDYYYSGEEKSFLASSLSSFLGGVVDAAKDRIITPLGQTNEVNAKNKVLEGLTSLSSNVTNQINESTEKNVQVSYVNTGKRVIIFFNESLNLTKASL